MSSCARCGTPLTPFDRGCPKCDGSVVSARSPTLALDESKPATPFTATSATIEIPSGVGSVGTTSAVAPVRGEGDSQSNPAAPRPSSTLDEDPLIAAIPKKDGERILGNARLLKRLGQGGMGAVYLGQHCTLDIPVAVKILAGHLMSDMTYAERFEREAKLSAKLDHPNVVRTINFGRDHGIWFLQMEFVEGASAADLLRSKGRLSEARALQIGRDVASALAFAHKNGIVHRDVKPDNILLKRDDGSAKLADLGLARLAHGGGAPAITGAGTTLGTPAYMAPEQIEDASHVNAAADVYSVGATLYELLCGKPPFNAPSIPSLFREILTLPPPDPRLLRPELSPGVRDLLLRTLQKKPAERIATAEELIAAIDRALLGATRETPAPAPAFSSTASPTAATASYVPPKPEAPAPPYGRHMAILGGGAVLAVIAALVLGWAYGRESPAPPGERPYYLGLLPETRLTTAKIQAMEPVLAFLKKHVKREWKLYVGANYRENMVAFLDGKVDLAQFGGASYVLVTQQLPDSRPVFQRDSDQRFETLFLVRSDDLTIRSLTDLTGKSIAFVDPLSTSGYVIPATELLDAGVALDQKAVQIKFLNAHDDAIDAVVRGECTAAAVDAGVYHRLAARKKLDHAKLRTLHVSQPFPDDVWVASPRLEPKLRERVLQAFLALDRNRPEDRLVLQALNADEAKFIAASDADYTGIRAKVRRLQDKGLLANEPR